MKKGSIQAIDRYFLTEPCPLTKKRQVKVKAIKVAFACAVGLSVLGLLVFGETAPPALSGSVVKDLGPESRSISSAPLNELPEAPAFVDSGYVGKYAPPVPASSEASRSYGSAQLVSRGSQSPGGRDSLPMGTMIPVALEGAVISSDQSTPAIARLTADAEGLDGETIPEGTRVFGNAGVDSTGERIQIRFQTLVLPDGTQKDISAMAMGADGAAGLAGDVDQRLLARNGGRVVGTFVGGLAEGLKDRQMGSNGIVLESGSVRNGLLNGLSSAALDQARDSASASERLKPVVTIERGRAFYLFLEKGYSG